MSANRCFDSFNNILSAKERTKEMRQVTIYNELTQNIQKLNTANPKKTNGYKYNRNTVINTVCDLSNGNVDFCSNYELYNDLKQGSNLVYPTNVSTPKYESWCGNLYEINYAKHGINNVLNADASFNYIVIDPSNLLFYNSCNKQDKWTHVVDLSFQNTFYAKSSKNKSVCN